MTTYLIFRRDADDSWQQVGDEDASSPKQALRKFHGDLAISPGIYAAVPQRNWTELSPELVTETRLVFR